MGLLYYLFYKLWLYLIIHNKYKDNHYRHVFKHIDSLCVMLHQTLGLYQYHYNNIKYPVESIVQAVNNQTTKRVRKLV